MARELREDRQVGAQPDPLEASDAQQRERPVVLEAADPSGNVPMNTGIPSSASPA